MHPNCGKFVGTLLALSSKPCWSYRRADGCFRDSCAAVPCRRACERGDRPAHDALESLLELLRGDRRLLARAGIQSIAWPARLGYRQRARVSCLDDGSRDHDVAPRPHGRGWGALPAKTKSDWLASGRHDRLDRDYRPHRSALPKG